MVQFVKEGGFMKLRGSFIVLFLNLIYIVGLIFLLIDGPSTQDLWAMILVLVGATVITWGYFKGKLFAVFGAFGFGAIILFISIPDGMNPGFLLYWLAGFLGGTTKK